MNQYVPPSPLAWRRYWQAKGLPWSTEPEMDQERRKELAHQRAIVAGITPGIALHRGEVEWCRRCMAAGNPGTWSRTDSLSGLTGE